MKSCAIVCLVIIFVTLHVVSSKPAKDLDTEWQNFKKDNNRNYANSEEETRRKELFRKTLESVEAHNAKFDQGLVTYKQGINFFADMTPEEKAKYSGGVLPKKGSLTGIA